MRAALYILHDPLPSSIYAQLHKAMRKRNLPNVSRDDEVSFLGMIRILERDR